MKILQINAVGQAMSTGRTCLEFQTFVNEQTTHECRTAFAQGCENQFSVRIGNPVDWKLHGLLSRLSGRQAHFSRLATRKLLRYMECYSPDVVLLHNLHGNYVNLPLLLRHLANNNIATIIILDDCWFYTGKCTHYTVTGCYRWETGCHDCPRLKMDNPSWFFDATGRLWQEKKSLFEAIPRLAVVGVSDWITGEARRSYLVCAKEICRIYNWIDLETFSPQKEAVPLRKKYGVAGKKVVLGVASGWSRAKGLECFLEISRRLNDMYQIVLIGQMPEGIGLPENILNIPPINSAQELAWWYNAADVFVTASLEESFGKVSAEALACGTPVVCFDSTANREIVGNACGRCIPPGNVALMVDAIYDICRQKTGCQAEICRSFAEKNFNKQARINEFLELCNRLLKS